MRQRLFEFLVAISFLFCIGCSPTLGYKGAALPESHVASIEGSVYFYGIATQTVGISYVDDMELAKYGRSAPDTVQVTPGHHQCRVRFWLHSGNSKTWTDYEFPVYVVAGGSYKLEFENYEGETYIWMNDAITGHWVAGRKPKKK